MSQLNRRNALTAVASLPVMALPAVAIAAAQPDPIFAAIEKHRACAAVVVACRQRRHAIEESLPLPLCGRQFNALMDANPEYRDAVKRLTGALSAEWESGRALIVMDLTTVAGAAALARYALDCHEADEQHGGDSLVDEFETYIVLDHLALGLAKLA
jgi:hypothetical protein